MGDVQGQEGRSLRSPEVLTPSQKLREAEEDEAAAAAVEDTPHHTSWGGRGRRGATGPSQLYPADSLPAKRKRAQVCLRSRPCPSHRSWVLQHLESTSRAFDLHDEAMPQTTSCRNASCPSCTIAAGLSPHGTLRGRAAKGDYAKAETSVHSDSTQPNGMHARYAYAASLNVV